MSSKPAVLALALYSLGAAGPASIFLVLRAAAEGVFWFRISGKDNRLENKTITWRA